MAYVTSSKHSKNTEWEQTVQPAFQSTVYRNLNGILSLFPQENSNGGSAYEFRVNTAANTSTEVFTEGSAQPTAVSQTYVMATLAYIYFRAMIRITGHMRDILKGQGLPAGFNMRLNEFQLGSEDIRDLMETTFQGTSNNGMQLACDSAGTYANIDRSSVTSWGSYENALSGALTIAAINNAREAIRDNDRGGRMDLIIMPHNQLTNLQALTPVAPLPRVASDFSSPRSQHAYSDQGARFGDADVFPVGDLTNTVLLYLDRRYWKYVIHRDMEIFEHDRQGDDELFQLSAAGTLVCENTQKQGKETGVTA